MSILDSTKQFFQKRKGAFFWTAIGSLGVYIAGKFVKSALVTVKITILTFTSGQYAKSKIEEITKKAELDKIVQDNVRKRFEQNQVDCTLTTLSYLPAISEAVLNAESLNVEVLIDQIKNINKEAIADVESSEMLRAKKLEKWEELKYASISRTVSSMYVLVLLFILVKIQLNLIARFTYLDSVDSIQRNLDSETPSRSTERSLSYDVEQKYLALSWYFVNKSIARIAEKVESSVRKVVADLTLSTNMSADHLNETISSIRKEVEQENGLSSKLGTWIIPDPDSEVEAIRCGLYQLAGDDSPSKTKNFEVAIGDQLSYLLEETRQYANSDDFDIVLESCMNVAQDQLIKNIKEEMQDDQSSDEASIIKPFAMLLSLISLQSHVILNGHPNLYLSTLGENSALNAFSAVIYASFEP